LPVLKAVTSVLSPTVAMFTAFNNVTGGAPGILLAVGAAVLTVGGIVNMAVPGLIMIRDKWLEITGAANLAATAQIRAANAAIPGAGGSTVVGLGGNAATAPTMGASTGVMAIPGGLAGGKAAMKAVPAAAKGLYVGPGVLAGELAGGTATAAVAAGAARTGAGVLGKAGGLLKGRLGGFGIGIVGGIAGGALQTWGAAGVEKMKAGQGGGGQAALGIVGGGALSGAATGAIIGSIIPGVGTAIGAGVGAILGTVSGIFKAKAASEEIAAARVPERRGGRSTGDGTNDRLDKLIALTEEQNKLVIGGGKEAGKQLTSGDLQRAFTRTLARGMV